MYTLSFSTKEISKILGQVKFFNGAPRLALHLKDLLTEKDLLDYSGIKGNIQFIDSQNLLKKEERFFEILKEEKK